MCSGLVMFSSVSSLSPGCAADFLYYCCSSAAGECAVNFFGERIVRFFLWFYRLVLAVKKIVGVVSVLCGCYSEIKNILAIIYALLVI